MASLRNNNRANAEKLFLTTMGFAEPLTYDFTDDQKAAFFRLKNFVLSADDSVFVLKGYAGTGKTWLIQRIVDFLKKVDKNCHIALTAPTNKAVKVLMKGGKIRGNNIMYTTVHSLLGLKEQINDRGDITFVKDKNSKGLPELTCLIVDEVSMLDDKLFEHLYDMCRRDMRIIFMGDPAQIPPIAASNCIPFRANATELYKIREASLKQIMRQVGDNPILEASFGVRENITAEKPFQAQTKLNEKGQGTILLNANDPEIRPKVQALLGEYFNCEEFRVDPDYAKVIAWRNATVAYFNQMIRAILYGELASQIVVGEKLIVNKPIAIAQKMLLTTSEELVVQNVSHTRKNLLVVDETISFRVYRCGIRYANGGGGMSEVTIDILDDQDAELYNTCCNKMKNKAKTLRGTDGWIRYYEFMRSFADVGYNYAITGHKAQGSTYTNVFLIEKDIDVNPKVVERNRIKYTCYSRPTNKLFILKDV